MSVERPTPDSARPPHRARPSSATTPGSPANRKGPAGIQPPSPRGMGHSAADEPDDMAATLPRQTPRQMPGLGHGATPAGHVPPPPPRPGAIPPPPPPAATISSPGHPIPGHAPEAPPSSPMGDEGATPDLTLKRGARSASMPQQPAVPDAPDAPDSWGDSNSGTPDLTLKRSGNRRMPMSSMPSDVTPIPRPPAPAGHHAAHDPNAPAGPDEDGDGDGEDGGTGDAILTLKRSARRAPGTLSNAPAAGHPTQPEMPASASSSSHVGARSPSALMSRAFGESGELVGSGKPSTRGMGISYGAAITHAEGIAKYNLGDELGRGGLGVVRAAFDTKLKRELAIKFLLSAGNSNDVAEFIEEAQITGQLEHPNIVPVHELGHDPDGRPFIAMKLVRGRTLQQMIDFWHQKRRQSTLADLVRSRMLDVFVKVCDAIAYAHNRGVIHRDLKPDNIMVGEFGEVLVMDWGLAKPLGNPERLAPRPDRGNAAAGRLSSKPGRSSSLAAEVATDRRGHAGANLTMQGEVLGTPGYMSPEQANGWVDQIDERSDVFALGAVLYAVLCHQPPYVGETVYDVVMQAAERKCKSPRRRAPNLGIPAELEAIAMKAMARDPRKRYAKVADLRSDIESFLANEPVAAYRDGFFEKISKWSKRNPTKAMMGIMGSVFGVILAVAGTFSVFLIQANEKAKDEAELRAQAETEAKEFERQRAEANERERISAEKAKQAAEEREKAQAEIAELKAAQAEAAERAAFIRDETDRVYKEFRSKLQQALSRGLNFMQFVQQLGRDEVQRYMTAIESLVEASERAGKQYYDGTDMHFLGQMYYAIGNRPKAALYYEKAVEMLPNEPVILTSLGGVYVDMGRFPAAIDVCDRAIAIDPNATAAYFSKAMAYKWQKKYGEAIATFEEAIRRAPQHVDLYINLSVVYHDAGRHDDALRILQRGQDVHPDHFNLNMALGGEYTNRGQFPQALPCFERAYRVNPNDALCCLYLGMLRTQTGNPTGAREVLAQAIRIAPTNADAHFQMGIALLSLNDVNGGNAALEKAVELKGNHWQAWLQLGVVRAQAFNDRPGAIEAFSHAYRHCKDQNQKNQIANNIRQLGGQPPTD